MSSAPSSGDVKPFVLHDDSKVTGVGATATVHSGGSTHTATVFQSGGTTTAHASTSTTVGSFGVSASATVSSKGSYKVEGGVGFDF